MKIHDVGFGLVGRVRATLILPEDLGPDPATPIHPDVVSHLVRRGRATVLLDEEDNLVVDVGLSAVARMLGHGENFPTVGGFPVNDVTDLRISTMKLGNDPTPAAPAVGDTDISVSPATHTISFVSFFYPDTVTTTAAGVVGVGESDLDGVGITEEGLFLANGALVARATFSAVVKVPTHAVQFEHSIQVVRP